MKNTCKQGYFPEINYVEDTCSGEHTSTDCIYLGVSIPAMEIDEGDNLTEVMKRVITAFEKIVDENNFYRDSIDKIKQQLEI